ncbi:MAG: type II toxin-antitoxin system VapC family toxin [candidate division WS1 bacterium]|nr:type II toxin-antitoxin system VapC family toxin [candidate division WS1 bacterium]
MILLDSSAWLGMLTLAPNSEAFRERLEAADKVVVPTIVLYEVYKVLRREGAEEEASAAALLLKEHNLVELDEMIALDAAETSLEHGLAMADAIIYTTAQLNGATLVTGDAHFDGLPGVDFIPTIS